jgi:hypothetical protein
MSTFKRERDRKNGSNYHISEQCYFEQNVLVIKLLKLAMQCVQRGTTIPSLLWKLASNAWVSRNRKRDMVNFFIYNLNYKVNKGKITTAEEAHTWHASSKTNDSKAI